MHVVRTVKNKEKTLNNMTEGKTVAVVMCTYNGEKFLREQLDSILRQTYPISEIIVQDDCSTDSTVAILRSYAARDGRVRVIVNEHNLGFNRNFRSAVMKATADFVAISDQDDVWMPDKIERQVGAIGQYNICYSDHLRGTTFEGAHTVSPRCSLEALMFGGFAGHTMLLRRDFVQRDDVWMDGIYYDWSLGLNAYFSRRQGDNAHRQTAQLAPVASAGGGAVAESEREPCTEEPAHVAALRARICSFPSPAAQTGVATALLAHTRKHARPSLPSSSHHGKTDAQPQSSGHTAPLHDMYEAPPRHISQRGEDQRNNGNGARLLLADDICLPLLAVRPVRFGARRAATTLSAADIIVSYYLRSHHFFSMAGRKLEVFVYICIMLSASGKNAVQTFMQHKLYKHNLL